MSWDVASEYKKKVILKEIKFKRGFLRVCF